MNGTRLRPFLMMVGCFLIGLTATACGTESASAPSASTATANPRPMVALKQRTGPKRTPAVPLKTSTRRTPAQAREKKPLPVGLRPEDRPGYGSAQVVFETPDGDLKVQVEVADTDLLRARGLMWRTELKSGAGMVFIFPDPQVHSFWMVNTLIPLDMIFVGENLTVVGVVASATPKTRTPRSVGRLGRFVVEVPGGWAAEHGVKAGTHMRLEALKSSPKPAPAAPADAVDVER